MVLVVAAVLLDRLESPTRMLAARRTGPPALAGGWEFPGGKVEPGETELDALHRELAEELGVQVRVGAEVPAPDGVAWPIADRLAMRVWLAEISAGVPEPSPSHDAVRWLTAGELFAVDWLPADVELVRQLGALLWPPGSGGRG